MIPRFITYNISDNLKDNFVVALFGARRTGKTVLMNEIIKKTGNKKSLILTGDDFDAIQVLSTKRLSVLKNLLAGYEYLFIDEAQKIPEIGANLKLIVDNISGVKIFITGSSALGLHEQTGEPLTGRSKFFHLYPIALTELNESFWIASENLESRLIYGMYPQVLNAKIIADKTDVLKSLRDGYLLKDLLELDNQKNSIFIFNLLRLIAFQIGNDISYSELASQLNVNKKTVQRYLDILEKTYILFSLHGFSRNLRKEYSKTPRYYFWDNGIRNILISNLNSLSNRDDIGKLWENFCIAERLKLSAYKNVTSNFFFWRTYDHKEIDLIEERDGKLFGYEFKWQEKNIKAPLDFVRNYPEASFEEINQSNFIKFLT